MYSWADFLDDPLVTMGVKRGHFILPENIEEPTNPRAFVSYRHRETGYAPSQDAKQRKWVNWLVTTLESAGVDVFWESSIGKAIDECVGTNRRTRPKAIWAEVCRVSVVGCHAFVPILTPGYLKRIGWDRGEQQSRYNPGIAGEEFEQARLMLRDKQIEMLTVVRRWPPNKERLEIPNDFLDGRFYSFFDKEHPRDPDVVADIVRELNICTGSIHPVLCINLQDIVSLYIDWNLRCVSDRVGKPPNVWKPGRTYVYNFLKAVHSERVRAGEERNALLEKLTRFYTDAYGPSNGSDAES